jgi:hypothetical protein
MNIIQAYYTKEKGRRERGKERKGKERSRPLSKSALESIYPNLLYQDV